MGLPAAMAYKDHLASEGMQLNENSSDLTDQVPVVETSRYGYRLAAVETGRHGDRPAGAEQRTLDVEAGGLGRRTPGPAGPRSGVPACTGRRVELSWADVLRAPPV